MNWLRLALGLIREAAATPAGQDVIDNMRGAAKRKPAGETPEPALDVEAVEAMLAEHRSQVDRNLEAIVRMLNEQNLRLTETVRRQRIWNFGLAAGLLAVLIAGFILAR